MICVAAFLSACFYAQVNAQELKSEFLFDLEINLNAPQLHGALS